eukprot:355319-Chlamydomonas_euryale.AAC.3
MPAARRRQSVWTWTQLWAGLCRAKQAGTEHLNYHRIVSTDSSCDPKAVPSGLATCNSKGLDCVSHSHASEHDITIPNGGYTCAAILPNARGRAQGRSMQPRLFSNRTADCMEQNAQ